jgi:hypothetical protein
VNSDLEADLQLLNRVNKTPLFLEYPFRMLLGGCPSHC